MRHGRFLSESGKEREQNDEHYMRICLRLARQSAIRGEVPVGALIVKNGEIIAYAHNVRETLQSPIAHAEILAIEEAARKTGYWRLTDCTLYVTLEPCPMCAGAIINSRVPRVVYGASDPKAGAMGTLYNLAEGRLNHTPDVRGGVLAQACGDLLSTYFRAKRRQQKEAKNLDKQSK